MLARNLQGEFKKRGPWVTKFVLNGQAYGGKFDALNDVRLSQFFQQFPETHTILEMGSLEGGHTIGLAKFPGVQRVLGLEGRQANLDRARFVQTLLGVTRVDFVLENLETVDLSRFGEFDAVFCVGLLYHLPRPWELIAQIARVSPHLFIWTHYAADKKANKTINGFRGTEYREFGLRDPLSGLSLSSFWPTLEALKDMLTGEGFQTIQVIEDNQRHPHGPAITLAATASRPTTLVNWATSTYLTNLTVSGSDRQLREAPLPRVADSTVDSGYANLHERQSGPGIESNFVKLKPRVLAILPGFIPSTVTLVAKPLMALHQAGRITADITLETIATRSQIVRADLIVFCRNVEPAHGRFLETARDLKKPIIYDLDDNFFDMPLATEQGRYHRDPDRLRQLEEYVAQASLVRVYSTPLRERVAVLNRNVEKITPAFDWSLIPDTPSDRGKSSRIKIVYATSRVLDNLARIFLDEVIRLAEHYLDNIELHFWGYCPPELNKHPAVRVVSLIPDYDRYVRQFYKRGYDIGLAPLLNDVFHLSKTNTKFREYSACRVAGIYSKVEVYTACVEDGVTGLLAPNQPGAWYEAMVRLIEDDTLRQSIQEQAQRYVRQHYSQEMFQQVWWTHIQRVLGQDGPTVVPGDGSHYGSQSVPTVQDRRGREPLPGRRPAGQGRSLLSRLRAHTPATIWYLVRVYWYDLGMLLKLRWLTSPLADFLRLRQAPKN